jgi:hypothetical protein
MIKRWNKYNEELGENFKKVKAITDDDGHWYIIPNELDSEFYKDLQNEDMIDSGDFDDKYGQYRTGGDLNLIQLYIKE